MAFTDAELVPLGDIVGMNPVELDDWLGSVTISAAVEDAIQADIVLWNASYANAAGVTIEPKESNFGARMNGDSSRADIVTRTRRRLQIPNPSAGYATMGSLTIG